MADVDRESECCGAPSSFSDIIQQRAAVSAARCRRVGPRIYLDAIRASLRYRRHHAWIGINEQDYAGPALLRCADHAFDLLHFGGAELPALL
jgi:hypothetical protein